MSHTEREYREALDSLRFSEQAKKRLIMNLEEQKEEQPVRRIMRPLWTGLIAAAVCVALVATAGAANLAAAQRHIIYLDKEQFKQEYNDYMEEHGHNSSQYNNSQYSGMDFTGADAEHWERWWQGPGGELVEETAGTAADGWKAKRVFKYWTDSWSHMPLHDKECTETRYRAGLVSDFSSLWDCWDASWLEEHYTTNPYWVWSRTLASGDELDFVAVGAEYRGDGDTQFNMSYSWDGCYVYEDEFRVTGGRQYSELYTTPDGVEVAIDMDTSGTGKSMFWVNLAGGHSSFSMFGTQMELEDLHDILDSLKLSKLLEYDPVK